MSDTFTRTYPEHRCTPTCLPPVHVTCGWVKGGNLASHKDFQDLAALTGEEIGEAVAVPADECPSCRGDIGITAHVSFLIWFACDVAGAPA